MNWKQYLAIAAMNAATLFGAGCASTPPVEIPKTQAQQIASIADTLATVKADKKITPQEAKILSDIGSQVDKLLPTVTDDNLKAYLAAQLKEADGYVTKSDSTIQAYLVLALRTDVASPVRVMGMQQNAHIPLAGTLDDHVNLLGIDKKKAAATTQEGTGWGYAQGDAANATQIKSISVEVPEENWGKVADYFVDGKIAEGGKDMSSALYRIKLDKNQVVGVRVVYARGDVSLE